MRDDNCCSICGCVHPRPPAYASPTNAAMIDQLWMCVMALGRERTAALHAAKSPDAGFAKCSHPLIRLGDGDAGTCASCGRRMKKGQGNPPKWEAVGDAGGECDCNEGHGPSTDCLRCHGSGEATP